MKKYLKQFVAKLVSVYKYTIAVSKTWHERLRVDGWYKLLGFELANVLVTGLLISIALVSFGYPWRPWLSLSFGLVPWLVVQILVYGKKQLQ